MRTVFLGTTTFAAAVLRRLADSPHRPVLVVSRPDRPQGRGRRISAPAVAEAARELEIELDQPASVNDPAARSRIAHAHPEAVCVCAFGALIKEPLLSDHLMLNVHPSLLPRWRGAAPVERAIIAGDELTGISIMRMSEGLDSGPVCAQTREPIEADDTYWESGAAPARGRGRAAGAHARSATGVRAPGRGAGDVRGEDSAEDRKLNPARPAAELERVVRALTPHIGGACETR